MRLFKWSSLVAMLAALLVLAACSSPGTPSQPGPGPDTPEPDPGTVQNKPALIEAYWENSTHSTGTAKNTEFTQHDTQDMQYRPRQWAEGLNLDLAAPERGFVVDDPGSYAGWDVLITHSENSNYASDRPDYLELTLNRPARVGVPVPSENPPSWMQGWERGGTIEIAGTQYTVYETTLDEGVQPLGGPEGMYQVQSPSGEWGFLSYPVLLAEEGGKPSPAPEVPAGLERPVANETCPAWVHDQYQAKGPDGRMYKTWHPQIDPVFWCYFRHEHGSDPSTFAGYPEVQPLFDYTMAGEPHHGFKVFTFEAEGIDGNAYSYMFTIHANTDGQGRVCSRFHTFDFAVANKDTGEVVADLHFAGDFGYSRAFDPAGALGPAGESYQYAPSDCPENAELTSADTGGRRNVNVEGGTYESWQVDLRHASAFPFVGTIIPVMDNPITSCNNDMDANGVIHCNTVVSNNELLDSDEFDNTRRWFNQSFYNPNGPDFPGFGLDTTTGGPWGEFYTDMYGAERLDPETSEHALRQYLKPGVRAIYDDTGKWYVADPWSDIYVNSYVDLGEDFLIRINRNLEHSVGTTN